MSTLKVGDIKHESFTGTTQLKLDSAGRLLVGTTTEGLGGADELTIATSGDTGLTIRSGTSSTGSIYFSDGTSGADEYRGVVNYNHASNFMRFYTDSTERLRIDSSGRVGIGTTSPNSYALVTVNDSNGISLTGSTQTRIVMQHANGGTNLKNFDIQTSDGNLRFRTIGDNNTSVTERLRIQSGGGISFNGDTAAANAISDYEEGTWQPTANGSNLSVTSGGCIYVKIGKLVLLIFDFTQNSGSAASSVGGLPYAVAKHSTFNLGYVTNSGTSAQGSTTTTGGRIDSPANTLIFAVAGGTNNPTLLNGQRIIGSGSYITT